MPGGVINFEEEKEGPMADIKRNPKPSDDIQHQAKALAKTNAHQWSTELTGLTGEELQRIIHQLRTREIELTLQNQALKEGEKRFRSMFEFIPGIAIQGYLMDGTTTYWNKASEGLYGYNEKEALGRNLLDLIIPPEMRQEVAMSMGQMARTGQPIASAELVLMRKDGSRVPVFSNHTLVQLPDAPLELFCLDVDLTLHKQAEKEAQALQEQNRQLHKAESLSRMAGAIAHLFNNQLTAVMGFLELTIEGLKEDEAAFQNLTTALAAAKRAAEISGLMLTYLGQTAARKTPINLAELCRLSLPFLKAAVTKATPLKPVLPSSGPAINGNATQIQQLLANLITNAGESMTLAGKGQIQIAIRTVPADKIPCSFRYPVTFKPEKKEYACIEILDTGCGIAPDDIDKIFDPFFTSKFTGRGLGLPVVLGILKAHEGAITVESKEGQGSRFQVFFPISEEALGQPSQYDTQPVRLEGSGGMVLIVEDETQVREIIKKMLTRFGFLVLDAKDGVEAVELFRQHRQDIRWVLCDLTMPRMNGWETLTALRNLSPGIPVILSSGYDEGQVMSGDHPEMPDAFLRKPFSKQDLTEVIKKIGCASF